MLRILAVLFGIAFIFGGVAGFVPDFSPNGLLFGFFEVHPLHNVVHIVTGVIAIMAATKFKYTKLFFQIFGIIYTIVAIIGFVRSGDLYVMHVNTADNILHLVIGVVSLYLGFAFKQKQT